MVKNFPKIIQQWTKNDFTMDQNGPKRSKNGLKMIQKLSTGGQKWLKWSKNGQNVSKNGNKNVSMMVQKWFKMV